MTASSGKAEPVFHCQHVLMITAKMPAVDTEGKIFLIFLPLGTEGRKSTKWMQIGSKLLRSFSFPGSMPFTQSPCATLLRIKFPHLLSNQVFLLNLWITFSLHSEMMWAASLYSCENRSKVPVSLLLQYPAHLHSLKFLTVCWENQGFTLSPFCFLNSLKGLWSGPHLRITHAAWN